MSDVNINLIIPMKPYVLGSSPVVDVQLQFGHDVRVQMDFVIVSSLLRSFLFFMSNKASN